MSDDIVTRLQCAYPSGEWPCESCTFCAARAEVERLRSAIDSLLADIDSAHEPDETGRLCGTCGAGDGSWPCVHRMALDELKEARRG